MKRVAIFIILIITSTFSDDLFKNSITGGFHFAFAPYRPIPYLSLGYERIGNKFINGITANYGHWYYATGATTEEFAGNLGAYYSLLYKLSDKIDGSITSKIPQNTLTFPPIFNPQKPSFGWSKNMSDEGELKAFKSL